jgi:hypothetical protein
MKLLFLLMFSFFDLGFALNSTDHNILLIVPGMQEKSKVLQQIERLFASKGHQIQLSCLVFTCLEFQYQQRADFQRYCVTYESYVGSYSDYLKVAIPSMIRSSQFTHIMVLHEQVGLSSTFNITQILRIMDTNDLQVVSPTVVRPWLNSSAAAEGEAEESGASIPGVKGIGHFTEVVELYAAVFTAAAWACQWDIIDPGVNPWAVGVELYFFHCCRHAVQPSLRMGIAHGMQAELGRALRHGRGGRGVDLTTNSSELCRLSHQTHPHHQAGWTAREQLAVWTEHLRQDRGFAVQRGSRRVGGELMPP